MAGGKQGPEAMNTVAEVKVLKPPHKKIMAGGKLPVKLLQRIKS